MTPRSIKPSRQVRDEIVGKCISGVIARPGHGGQPPVILMLQFDDGSVLEFISPRSDRLLKQAIGAATAGLDSPPGQMALARF